MINWGKRFHFLVGKKICLEVNSVQSDPCQCLCNLFVTDRRYSGCNPNMGIIFALTDGGTRISQRFLKRIILSCPSQERLLRRIFRLLRPKLLAISAAFLNFLIWNTYLTLGVRFSRNWFYCEVSVESHRHWYQISMKFMFCRNRTISSYLLSICTKKNRHSKYVIAE